MDWPQNASLRAFKQTQKTMTNLELKMQTPAPFRRISVIGLGYIGLPTAAMFASRKIEVVGVDVNPATVETINRGEIHIIEPDLDMVVRSTVSEGYLRATTVPEAAEAFLIAVPTPFKGEKHEPDLSYIEAASKAIAPVLKSGDLVVLESTSPVGATLAMANWLAEARPDLTFPQNAGEASDIRVAHCPERVLPGKVMQELITNDRVIGGITGRCSYEAARLYRVFVKGECITANNPKVAELAKLTENSFRDVNIAFANELSIICAQLDIDVWELIALANRHPRVNILQPGPGVGGHCIAVDPWFIVSSAPEHAQLIRTAREVNDEKPNWVLRTVQSALDNHLSKNLECKHDKVTISIYGLTFKPDIDDLRESPALQIAAAITDKYEGRILVVEPNINKLPRGLEKASLVPFEMAHAQGQIHILLVDHKEFKHSKAPHGQIIDTRGIWNQT